VLRYSTDPTPDQLDADALRAIEFYFLCSITLISQFHLTVGPPLTFRFAFSFLHLYPFAFVPFCHYPPGSFKHLLFPVAFPVTAFNVTGFRDVHAGYPAFPLRH